MKTTHLFAMAGVALTSYAQGMTALEALREIPAADCPALAMIDGHEGAPEPDRWHFLFYDSTAENGFREFVVADGEVVAKREFSQFAEKLTPDQAVGDLAIQIDSDTVTRIAQRFAVANRLPIASMNFALRKDDLDGAPVWTVVCRDEQERPFASLVITSEDGRIVSHEGFAIDPSGEDAKRVAKAVAVPVKRATAVTRVVPRPRIASRYDENLPPIYEGPREYRDEDGTRIRRAEPVDRSSRRRLPVPNPIDDVVVPIHRFVRSLLPF